MNKTVPRLDKSESGQMLSLKVQLTYLNVYLDLSIYDTQCVTHGGLGDLIKT